MIIALLILALAFDFLNGFHDSSNIVATVIASRALNPTLTLLLAASAEFAGPFIFGVAVAETVGEGLLQIEALSIFVVVSALLAAVLWNIVTWYFGLPSSSSHALVGGLLGSAILSAGVGVVQLRGVFIIFITLFISPLIGFIVGLMIMRIIVFSVRQASPRINIFFRRIQLVTFVSLALSHGTNDAQKTMGVITLGLVTVGYLDIFYIPLWVIAISAGAIALGTAFGGWRLIRTMGGRIIRVHPIHGFTSQLAGAVVILSAALFGGPVSTTQVMGSAILGVGAAERISKVRWGVSRDMLVAWFLTIPANMTISSLVYLLFASFFGEAPI
jgi:PiT family inorganic phosphate transporter